MLDIRDFQDEIADLCKRLRVRRLDLFGSATTSDFRADSDIDVLVQFERDGTGLFDRYFELKERLEEIFGRSVDVVVEDAITNPYFKQGIERQRKNIYAA